MNFTWDLTTSTIVLGIVLAIGWTLAFIASKK